MLHYVFDTFAWIEELAPGPHADEVYAIHLAHDVGTPDVVIAEIMHAAERRGHPHRDAILEAVESTSTPLATTREIAKAAGALRAKLDATRKGIGIVDCIVLETARAHSATLLTGDAHLKGLKGVQFIG